jgi:hypothetical protein
MRIEIDKLLTPTNYGVKLGISRQAVHKQIKEGKLRTVSIDGVIFIKS